MPTDRSYRVLAHELRVVASPRNLAFLHRFLAPFEAEVGERASVYEVRREPGERKPWAIYRDGRRLLRGSVAPTVLEFALWDVSRMAIASDHGFLAVHAAAASWQGRGIVLPAPPDSGKSTLVAGLTRAGFSYLTDEAALIDPVTAELQPFPRSLWLERSSIEAVFGEDPAARRWKTGVQFHVSPADLRTKAIGGPCAVRYVVAPTYQAGSETALVPMSRAEAVVLLARSAFHLKRFGGAGIELLGRAVAGADCFRATVGDLGEAVSRIQDLVAADHPAPGAPVPEGATAAGTPARSGAHA